MDKTIFEKMTGQFFIGLCLSLIPFYFFRFSIDGIRTNIFELAVFFTFLVNLLSLNWKTVLPKSKLSYILFFLFIILSIFSIYIAPDRIKALGIIKGWFLVPMVLGWLLYKRFDRNSLPYIFLPLYIVLLAVSLWAVLQNFHYFTTSFYQIGDANFDQYIIENRAFGPFESPNYLAMFIVPVLFLSLSILEVLKIKAVKLLMLMSYILPVSALYYSGSRGGIIAFFVGIFLFLNYRFINKVPNTKPFFYKLFAGSVVLTNTIYLYLTTRLIEGSGGGDKIRIEIYQYALKILKKYYLFGVGLGNFQNIVSLYSKENAPFQKFALEFALHPHNLLLAVWLNLGLLGLALSLYLLIVFFRNVYSSDSVIRAVLIAAMFSILIQGLFDTTYFKNDLSAIFWLIFSAGIIISKKPQETIT